MGAKYDWSNLKSRIAGKWQIPLLAVALAMFAGTIYRTRPEVPAVPFKVALARLDEQVTGRHFSEAIRDGRNFAARADLTASQRAQVELRLGRARFGALSTTSPPNSRVAGQIAKHFRAASPALESPPLLSDDFVTLGRLLRWQGQHEQGIGRFEKAIDLGHPQADDLRKEIFIIHRDRLAEEPKELSHRLDEMLAKLGAHRLDVRVWFIEEKLNLAERLDGLEETEALLSKEAAQFTDSDYWPQFEFLRCRLLVAMGRHAEAEVRLRALRNQVDASSEVSAMAGWLLGTILAGGESEAKWNEALSFFSDVLQQQGKGPYAAASCVGQGAALAKLNRHEDAIASYGKAVKQLGSIEDNRVVSLPALRGSLAVTAEMLRQKGDLRNAVEYASLAVRLAEGGTSAEKTLFVQPLALLEEQLAEENSSGTRTDTNRMGDAVIDAKFLTQSLEAIRFYESAAHHFDELANWNVFDEPRSAEFSWKAAELFTKSGAFDEAGRRYRSFLSQRPEDHRGPTALLRVGQLHYARGELAQAVEAFQECHQRFPKSFDGARALVPLARTYLAMGREKLGDAERALRMVLDDSDVFTPEAGEFVEGLFLLGDVLERGERYEPAISTLHEALDRYPSDPRVPRGRFLLGGAYRKSALAMRVQGRETQGTIDLERIREESARRFRSAREVYRKLIDSLEYRSLGDLDEREQMYLRHSFLYEADCYFETQDYADALKLYEQAAGNLRDSARGLSAHVQMINCHVFLGKTREARAAQARALVVVSTMPDSAFANRVSPESRGEWKSYFEWLGETELF